MTDSTKEIVSPEQQLIKGEPEPQTAVTPSELLQIAVAQNADIDKLEKLMELQQRWDADQARKAFVVAMAGFRAEAPTITKNRDGHNSRYATLNQITETVNPLLSKHGLSFAWVTDQGDQITVHCDVTHILGHSARVSLSAGADGSGSKNSIQAIGSTVSYLQRYTLLASLGLATGECDDDGEGSEAISDEQAEQLKALLQETNSDPQMFLKAIGAIVDNVDALPGTLFDRGIRALERKKAKLNADS